MFEDIWKKWKLLLNSTDVIPSLFKTTKSFNIVDVWWGFFPFFPPPETDKWVCQTNQKRASEVRLWYFSLNVSSHSGSRLRSVQSLFLPTWKCSTDCKQRRLAIHRWIAQIPQLQVGCEDDKVHVIHAFKQTVVYWDGPSIGADMTRWLEWTEKMDGRHFKPEQWRVCVFGGFNSTSAAL